MSRATARAFVRHFAQMVRDQGDDHFRRGLACAEEWERLSAEARPSRAAVVALLEHAVCIDTWPHGRGGWLTCLDVATGRVWQASEDGAMSEGWLSDFA